MANRFADNLTTTFFRRSLWIALIFCGIISLTVPPVIYHYHIHQYELESAEILNRFISEDLCFRPEYLMENQRSRDAAVEHISVFMKFGQLVEFKLWTADATLVYAYNAKELIGKKFSDNSKLHEALASGETVVELESSDDDDSRYLRDHGKLVDVYAPIISEGKVIGAVEVYRAAPKFTLLKTHIALVLSITVILFILLYLLLSGQFRRATTELLGYDEKLEKAYSNLGHSYFDTIRSLIKALELRDMETEGHSERVVALSIFVGERLGIIKPDLDRLVLGSYLHDIGKIGVPDSILHKPGPLTTGEYEKIRSHVEKGLEIIGPIEFLEPAAEVIRYHHEKWDGSGYNEGLRGAGIPVSARIFAVVDVFDALVSDRPYRSSMAFDAAKEVILGGRGNHFDPEIVDLFMAVTESEYEALKSEIATNGIHHTVNEAVANLLSRINGS